MEVLTIATLPATCSWKNEPVGWSLDAGQRLSIAAGPKTDWFIDPAGGHAKDSAPAALFTPPDADCILSARVEVAFASDFDAGTLQVRVRDDLWAKLCFEYSPQKQPMIVSVVTRGVSDDCNSVAIDGNATYLRVARTPTTLAFHYSHDGRFWNFVRHFSLGETAGLLLGFSSQSPTGKGCTAVFSEICYLAEAPKDNRDGS